MANTRKYGDWDTLKDWRASMKTDKWRRKYMNQMDALGKAIRGTVKGHIKKQDLPWKPLKPITIQLKGHDTIYVHTIDYYNKIRSQLRPMDNDGISLTVAPRGKHVSGLDMQVLARMLEYGTSKMPARPLWRPSYEEVQKLPEMNRLKDLGAKFSFKG
ncbi:MAG: hypothetical protein ACXADB_14455 [Candidatus Hermodarchaeia archaeon]|jgi:hypothetical protein